MQNERARILLCVALAPLLSACSEDPLPANAKEPPPTKAARVILVTCDTLRADRLGVYGYARPTSPHLDAFAHDAVVFDEAYTNAPLTSPAISSLLTGRLPGEIGIPGGNRYPMPPEAVTIAELARGAGIETAAVVSNGVLRRPPPEFGDAGVAQGFETFDDTMGSKEHNRDNFERLAPETTDAAIGWLEKRGSGSFFLWVHYQDPHGPYTPPPEFAARFDRPPTDEPRLALSPSDYGWAQLPRYQSLGDERRPEVYRARYDAEIAVFDEHLGRLFGWLGAKGWWDDTLIVFSADHGESLGEHGYWFCHGENVYREQVWVPLLVHFPKGMPHVAGRAVDGVERVAALCGHLDLWPTILEGLGIDPPPNRGTSLFRTSLPERRVNAQACGRSGSPRRWLAISDGAYRLVTPAKKQPQLFDILSDPDETHDLASADRKRVDDMLARYEGFLATNAIAALPQGPPRTDPDAQKALKKLGYTDGEGHDD